MKMLHPPAQRIQHTASPALPLSSETGAKAVDPSSYCLPSRWQLVLYPSPLSLNPTPCLRPAMMALITVLPPANRPKTRRCKAQWRGKAADCRT